MKKNTTPTPAPARDNPELEAAETLSYMRHSLDWAQSACRKTIAEFATAAAKDPTHAIKWLAEPAAIAQQELRFYTDLEDAILRTQAEPPPHARSLAWRTAMGATTVLVDYGIAERTKDCIRYAGNPEIRSSSMGFNLVGLCEQIATANVLRWFETCRNELRHGAQRVQAASDLSRESR